MTDRVTKHPAAVALGRLGGLAGGTTSAAKAEACRRNGRLGGRPPSRKDRDLVALRAFASTHDTLDDAAAALAISRQWMWTLLTARARPSARIRTLLPTDSPLTESEQADYEERAAVLEFDAGNTRAEAERLALAIVRKGGANED